MNIKIAIVDSGIGGLSLLKTLIGNLSEVSYIYLADLKNIPYGSKSREQLLCLTIKNVNMLIEKYSPDVIAFGCNTIGTTILDDIKKIFPAQKFFAIKPNIESVKTKTLVIATNSTINALSNCYAYKNNKKNIVLCKMPKLATKVENYIQNGANLVPYLKNKLCKFKDVKTIILGCTHYYFVKNPISKILPDAEIIDGTKIVLNQIKKYLSINYNKTIETSFKKNSIKSKQKISNVKKNYSKNSLHLNGNYLLDAKAKSVNKAEKINITWCLTDKKENLAMYKKVVKDFLKNQNSQN